MLRALVVDDAPVNREFLLLALESLARCDAAASGEEALALFERALSGGLPYEAVFLDIMLPGMNGLQTLERMRTAEDAAGLPEPACARVIITTGLDDDHAASRAFISGRAVSYMTKPFRLRQIREELVKLGLVEAG